MLARADRTDHVEAAVLGRDEAHRLGLRRDAFEGGARRDRDVHEGRIGRPGDRCSRLDEQLQIDRRGQSGVVELEPGVGASQTERGRIEAALGQGQRDVDPLVGRDRTAGPGGEWLARVGLDLARRDQVGAGDLDPRRARHHDDSPRGLSELDRQREHARPGCLFARSVDGQAVAIFDALFAGVERPPESDHAVFEGESIAQRAGARGEVAGLGGQATSDDALVRLAPRQLDHATAGVLEAQDLGDHDAIAHPVYARTQLLDAHAFHPIGRRGDLDLDERPGRVGLEGDALAEGDAGVPCADEIDDAGVVRYAAKGQASFCIRDAVGQARRAIGCQGVERDREAFEGLVAAVAEDLDRELARSWRRGRRVARVAGMLRPAESGRREAEPRADQARCDRDTKMAAARRRDERGERTPGSERPGAIGLAHVWASRVVARSGCGQSTIRQPKTKMPPPAQPQLTRGL